jgi:pimeloyl-ACP methyl ester carboxylesterase
MPRITIGSRGAAIRSIRTRGLAERAVVNVEPILRRVSVSSGTAVLRGDLVLPPGLGPHPAAVLVTGGSGPRDRGNWVSGLARSGLAVLTWDSPGFGESPGSPQWQAPDARALEVGAAVDLLRSMPETARPGIGVIGVDSGCWAAALAATLASRVAALALVAPPWGGAAQHEVSRLSHRARAYGFSRAEADLAVAVLHQRIRQLRLGQDGESVWAAEAPCRTAPWYPLLPGTQPSEIRAFGTLDLYRPEALLAAVGCPVLGILGADDPATSAPENLAALRSVASVRRDLEVAVLPRTDVVFGGLARGAPVSRPPGDWSPEVVLCLAGWMVPRIRQWQSAVAEPLARVEPPARAELPGRVPPQFVPRPTSLESRAAPGWLSAAG